MFIKTLKDNDLALTFIKSANVKAFPCGRRRSADVASDKSDKYYFPFDPEARLNTEANNRKHSGVNGFTQTYLKEWSSRNRTLTLSLAGYLFDITLDDSSNEANSFADAVVTALDDKDINKIYANIRLEELVLFDGFETYTTTLLRNQSASATDRIAPSLDIIKSDESSADAPDNYYFSGLSFSASPITGKGHKTRDTNTITVTVDTTVITQHVISLCILEKVEDTWKIHEPAWLPELRHGDTANSVVVGDLHIEATVNPEDSDETINKGDLTVANDAVIGAKLTVGSDAQKVIIDSNADDYVIAAIGNITITGNAEISETLVVTGAITAENNVEVSGTITARESLEGDTVNLDIAKAQIDEITGTAADITSISASTVVAEDTVSTAKFIQNDYNVPIIELTEDAGFWQLKISSINKYVKPITP